MKVPFLDLRVPFGTERDEFLVALETVLDHGRVVMGPEALQLENTMAAKVGHTHGVGTGSGTAALILALKGFGIGPGDEVITTPFSFVASSNSIVMVGATPVFADISEDLNLDPATIEPLITNRTKAILPVHWTGRVCDMPAIMAIAKRHDLLVIEDCSQACFAEYKNKKAGGFGHAGCFSFNSMKVLASLGEAGMVLTSDKAAANRMTLLRANGVQDNDTCIEVSQNLKMDTIQAAFLLVRLNRVEHLIDQRGLNAEFYNKALAKNCRTPAPADGRHSYYTYTIQIDKRDELREFLAQREIETSVQHRLTIPQHPAFKNAYTADCPHAEELSKRVICLPANEKITPQQRQYVADSVNLFFSGTK
jgi:dTDP-4-amino-4,6-dideoxygalactose transaminase